MTSACPTPNSQIKVIVPADDDELNVEIGYSMETVEMLAQGRGNEMLDTLYERYEAYARGRQLVLVEGTHEDGPVGAYEKLMPIDLALVVPTDPANSHKTMPLDAYTNIQSMQWHG